jgi:hypothetical protein
MVRLQPIPCFSSLNPFIRRRRRSLRARGSACTLLPSLAGRRLHADRTSTPELGRGDENIHYACDLHSQRASCGVLVRDARGARINLVLGRLSERVSMDICAHLLAGVRGAEINRCACCLLASEGIVTAHGTAQRGAPGCL